LVAAAKFLVEATKKSFVVPNFVAVTEFFFRESEKIAAAEKSAALRLATQMFKVFHKTYAFCVVKLDLGKKRRNKQLFQTS